MTIPREYITWIKVTPGGIVAATDVKESHNPDLVGLDALYNRILEECYHCSSASGNEMNDHDMTRNRSYIAAIRYKLSYLTGLKELDTPKVHPRRYLTRADAVVALVENESINELIIKYQVGRDELRNSNSARQGSGIKDFDYIRQTAIVDDIENYINEYVEKATPLDFVESSPRRTVSPAGKTGI